MHGTRRRSIFTARLTNSTAKGDQPRVIDDLRRAILAGDEPPGTLIPIDAVAAFFQVSQIPVREALKELLGEGLVEHVQHVGYSVAKLTFAEFGELYDVRWALETAGLRQAVRHAAEQDDEAARAAHRNLLAAMDRGDERAYHAASRTFHLMLLRPARMQRLVHMYEAAWNLTEPARPMSRLDRAEHAQFCVEHERMMTAFFARDADALVAESDAHYRHLKDALEALGDDPELFRQPS